jgi:hypothetical protein
MEILEIQPDLQNVVLNADKKLSVQLRVRLLHCKLYFEAC